MIWYTHNGDFMDYNIYDLPEERKISFKNFWTFIPTILTIFILGDILILLAIDNIYRSGLVETEPISFPIMITLLLPTIITLFILLLLIYKHVQCIKKGDRIYVQVVNIFFEFVTLKAQIDNTTIKKIITIHDKYSRKLCATYTYLPAFIYKKKIVIDWLNVSQYGHNKTTEPQNNKKTFDSPNIEKKTSLPSNTNVKLYKKHLERSHIYSINTQLFFPIYLLILYMTFIYINDFDLSANIFSIILNFSIIELIIFIILLTACFLHSNKKLKEKNHYMKSLKEGEKVLAEVEVSYHDNGSRYLPYLILVFTYIKNGKVYVNKYHNRYAGKKKIYDILKTQSTLPAIYYDEKIYPDWNAIAAYIDEHI